MAPRPVIAYVVNSLNPGGTERLVCDMSLAFRDRYAVEVYCLDEPGAWAPVLRPSFEARTARSADALLTTRRRMAQISRICASVTPVPPGRSNTRRAMRFV